MNKRLFIIRSTEDAQRVGQTIAGTDMVTPLEVSVKVHKPSRSLEQNSKMWAMLNDISKQIQRNVAYPNGEIKQERLRTDEWKNFFSGHLKGFKQIAGIDGGLVMIGRDTSGMNKQEMTDLIELMYMFGARHDVAWSED